MTEPEAPGKPQKVEGRKDKLPSFLSHPAVAILGLLSAIVGLISLPLSIYFYYAAKEYPQLSYYVSPAKAVVVKAGQASRLTASYDGRVIDSDITAAQVALWNAGSKPIKGADVLKAVTIHTDDNTPILEATIRKASREVTQLALNADELSQGRVTISWNILERNDGGVVQLIYAGDPNVKISVDGVLEGQPELIQLSGSQKRTVDRSFGWTLLVMGMGFLGSVIYSVVKFRRRLGEAEWLSLGMFLLCSIVASFIFYISRDVGPPFGF